MRKLHADPAFKEKHREAAADRMRKLHADPAFKEKHRFLAGLSDDQKRLYHKLRANGIGRDAALAEVSRATERAA